MAAQRGGRIRLVVVPVLRDRWVFAVQHHAETLALHDTAVPTTTTVGGAGWGKHLQRRATELLGRAKDSYDRLPPQGLSGRLKAGVDALNRRLDPSESMLKCLTAAHKAAGAGPLRGEGSPKPSGQSPDPLESGEELAANEGELQIQVVYPAQLSGEQVRATLSQLVATRTKRHQNLVYGSTAMLPVSLAMGLLPGPNVFLGWNAYRLYSHVQALRGGRLFLDLTRRNRISYSPCHELEAIVRSGERHEGAPLSQGQIQELTAKYGLKTLSEDVERILRIGSRRDILDQGAAAPAHHNPQHHPGRGDGEDDGSSSKTSIK